MDDPNYLPVVPLFKISNTDKYNKYILCDALTLADKNSSFQPAESIAKLNRKDTPEKEIENLITLCNQNISQACLIVGRIYEFGSYNCTENISLAYSFYLQAQKMGSFEVVPILSYFHRHFYFQEIEKTIVESDFSNDFLESALSNAFQYENGIFRPISCEKSYEILKPFSKSIKSMIQFNFPLSTENEIETATNGKAKPKQTVKNGTSKYLNHFYKAKEILTRPYLSKKEIKDSINLLNISLEHQYLESASILAQLYLDGYICPINMTLIRSYLEIGIQLRDPLAYLLTADLFSIDEYVVAKFATVMELIKNAAFYGFSPAIHRWAYFVERGYMKFKRSKAQAVKLYMHSGALGYLPSLHRLAKLYYNGVETTQSCELGNANLRKVLNFGPLAKILNRYIKKGSISAYIKMIDLNLAPSKSVNISSFDEINARNNMSMTKLYFDISKLYNVGDTKMKKAHEAAFGDEAAIIWMILSSPSIEDAIEWTQKLKMLSPIYIFISWPIKLFLIMKNLLLYINNQLNEKQTEIFNQLSRPIFEFATIIFTLLTLILFICIRVTKFF